MSKDPEAAECDCAKYRKLCRGKGCTWKAPATAGEWTHHTLLEIRYQTSAPDQFAYETAILKRINAALAAERKKADNLFEVARKHCVENQKLKKRIKDNESASI